MATSTINKMLKSKEVSVTLSSGQTAEATTHIPRNQIVGVVLKKTTDVFYTPIVYSVYDNGNIEVRTIQMAGVTEPRTYTFLVWYI